MSGLTIFQTLINIFILGFIIKQIFKHYKQSKRAYMGFFSKRPLRYIKDGKIVNASKEFLNSKVTNEYVNRIRSDLEAQETSFLKNYYLILKTDNEAWSTFDSNLNQITNSLILPTVTAVIGFFIGGIKETSGKTSAEFTGTVAAAFLSIFIIQLVVLGASALLTQKVAIKKVKAFLLINLIKNILKERENL